MPRNYDEGGAIDDTEGDPNATDPQGSAMGNSIQQSINAALQAVNDTLSYGRQLHGLGGGGDNEGAIQTADRMPTVPGSQSNSGQPPVRPQPGPLPPTSNPFGKRAGLMPSVPGGQSNSGQPPVRPMPGPLPPTSNPFGKRADAGDSDGSDDTGAIDDTEEEAA